MAALLDSEIDFRGLTPGRSWEASGADAVLEMLLAHRSEDSDEIEQMVSETHVLLLSRPSLPALRVPVLATKTGDSVLLVASKAGAVKHPAWYHNVRANPDVEVTIDGQHRPMRADIAAEGEGREQLWRIVCDNYSGYATYQRRAQSRVIPVVVLRPR